MATATEVSKADRCDITEIQVGDRWSRHSYGQITRLPEPGRRLFGLRNENGDEWEIGDTVVAREFNFANQYKEVVKRTRTEMVETILASRGIAMTINFKKKPEHKELVSTVATILDDIEAGKARPAARSLSRQLKLATDGEERTMVGRHYGTTDEFGRIQFSDMEKGQQRLVDPRTVEWCIVANARYEVK